MTAAPTPDIQRSYQLHQRAVFVADEGSLSARTCAGIVHAVAEFTGNDEGRSVMAQTPLDVVDAGSLMELMQLKIGSCGVVQFDVRGPDREARACLDELERITAQGSGANGRTVLASAVASGRYQS